MAKFYLGEQNYVFVHQKYRTTWHPYLYFMDTKQYHTTGLLSSAALLFRLVNMQIAVNKTWEIKVKWKKQINKKWRTHLWNDLSMLGNSKEN